MIEVVRNAAFDAIMNKIYGTSKPNLVFVTYIGEIEGESHREPEGESTVTCRYIGEGNMGHMGLTLWALTPPFKLKVEAEDLKH